MTRKRDIDLLRLEMDTLWGADVYGRTSQPPLVALGIAGDEKEMRFAPDLTDELRHALTAMLEAGAIAGNWPGLPSIGNVQVKVAPSFVFESSASFLTAPPPFQILTSARFKGSPLPTRPDKWWEVDEWNDLLEGRLGPWAMLIEDYCVVSLCHTPVASRDAAEAGVWTLPEYRGRGLAAIAASAWATVAELHFETLFYSTSSENTASLGVARQLGLRPIGSIRQLSISRSPDAS